MLRGCLRDRCRQGTCRQAWWSGWRSTWRGPRPRAAPPQGNGGGRPCSLHQAVPPQGRFAVGIVAQDVRASRLEQGDAPEPFIVDLPVQVRIEFAKSSQADCAALIAGLRREGTRVRFPAEEMLSAYHTFRAAVELAG